MSWPDYTQTAEDHQSLLILVKHIGHEMNTVVFNRIYERISKLRYLVIQEQRIVWLRYKKNYQVENNEWGDFQTHRMVLGLLSVGKCSSQVELNELYKYHEVLRDKYSPTVLDSRCLVFGSGVDDTIEKKTSEEDKDRDSGVYDQCSPQESNEIKEAKAGGNILTRNDSLPERSLDTRRFGLLFYPSIDNSSQLEEHVKDFISSLFWVLEAKRLDRSYEKCDKIPLLYAPFEKKDYEKLIMESRTIKKRCLGRMKKHVGDWYLLANLPGEAITYYTAAADLLKACNDWFWYAGALEGLCSASVILIFPPQRPERGLQRNASFTALGSQTTSQLKGRTGSGSLYNALTMNGMEENDAKNKNSLSPDDITQKYWEIVNNYHKFQPAHIIEAETSFKAARVLSLQKKPLHAAEFLQIAVVINLPLPDEEKIHRYSVLSQLYNQIGFHRKAAFFKRIAAMKCIKPKNPNPAWNQSYYLLLQTLEGYKIILDPKEIPKDHIHGWPALQIQILQELVQSARKMGNPALAVRHMTYLLHAMFNHLTPQERREFANQLETYTYKCEGTPIPLPLENSIILSPVNLTRLPTVKSFRLQNLVPHLRPMKLKPDPVKVEDMGPFIYSPLDFRKERVKKNLSEVDFKWVERDVCEVVLEVFNPMPFELKVSSMGLLADNVAFEGFPTSLSLPAESGHYPVNLLGTPKSVGKLTIYGYTTHVLGVKSNCKLKDLPQIKVPHYTIEVIPALPQMQICTSLPKSATFSSFSNTSNIVTSASVCLYAGESHECTLTLMNSGKEPIEKIIIDFETWLDKESEKNFLTWSKENLESQLPLLPGNSAILTLYINSVEVGDFVCSDKQQINEVLDTGNTSVYTKSRSRGSVSGSGIETKMQKLDLGTPESYPSKLVEAVFKLKYSGGPGMQKGYCRQCAVAFNVEILPSVMITKWDVLPAEMPSHCYLVLDMLNTTCHEMEVQYFTNKRILIEAKESCRVPISVERCPLSKIIETTQKDSVPQITALMKICQEHVASLVDIRWSLAATETFGNVSISKVEWSNLMVNTIRMSPLQWDVDIDGHPFRTEEEYIYKMSELITINITVSNLTESCIYNLYLNVLCHQDHQNGNLDYRLENKLGFSGYQQICIKEIPEGNNYKHSTAVIFFCPGLYKLDIVCSSGNPSGKEDIIPNPYKGQIWKCTPIIELTIKED